MQPFSPGRVLHGLPHALPIGVRLSKLHDVAFYWRVPTSGVSVSLGGASSGVCAADGPRSNTLVPGFRWSPQAHCSGGIGFLFLGDETPMMHFLRNFVRDEDGPTSVEYAVMLALIISVCAISITLLGDQNAASLQDSATKLGVSMAP